MYRKNLDESETLISSNYPSLAQGDAIRIAKADSRLAEILALDERYGKQFGQQ